MIIVRGFDNMEELNHYRKVMASSADFRLPQGVRPIAISDDDFRLLLEQGRSFDEYFRYREEQNYIDTQADLLLPEIETLPEAEAASEAITAPDVSVDEEASSKTMTPEEPASPAPPSPAAPAPAAKPAPAPSTPALTPIVPGSEGDDDPLLNE